MVEGQLQDDPEAKDDEVDLVRHPHPRGHANAFDADEHALQEGNKEWVVTPHGAQLIVIKLRFSGYGTHDKVGVLSFSRDPSSPASRNHLETVTVLRCLIDRNSNCNSKSLIEIVIAIVNHA